MIMIEDVILVVSEGLGVEVFGQFRGVFGFKSRLWFTGRPPSSITVGIDRTRESTRAYTRPAVNKQYIYVEI